MSTTSSSVAPAETRFEGVGVSGELLSFLIGLAALGSALVAGIFFAFSAFVMQALGRLPPAQGIAAMQAINVTVLNPWFFGAVFGTAALCLVLGIAAFLALGDPAAIWRLAGSGLYLVTCILVTIVFNVPLNNRLARVAPDSAEGSERWAHYLTVWTAWNHVRTAGSLAAAAAFILALFSAP